MIPEGQRRSRSRAIRASLTALVTAALICWVRSCGLSRLASTARRSSSSIVRIEDVVGLQRGVDHRVGEGADRGLEEAVQVRRGRAPRRRGRTPAAASRRPSSGRTAVEQAGAQRVDLRRRCGSPGCASSRVSASRLTPRRQAAPSSPSSTSRSVRPSMPVGREVTVRAAHGSAGWSGSNVAAAVGELDAEHAAHQRPGRRPAGRRARSARSCAASAGGGRSR